MVSGHIRLIAKRKVLEFILSEEGESGAGLRYRPLHWWRSASRTRTISMRLGVVSRCVRR